MWRDGKETTVQAVLAEKPSDLEASADGPKKDPSKPVELSGFGLKVLPAGPETKDKFQLSDTAKGVVVVEVQPDSVAAERGIKPGDLIVEVQQMAVATPADIKIGRAHV